MFVELTGLTTRAKIDVAYGKITMLSTFVGVTRTGTVVYFDDGREVNVRESRAEIKELIRLAREG